jgi:hypothetical protein
VFNGKYEPSNNSNFDPIDEAINLFYKSKKYQQVSCNITICTHHVSTCGASPCANCHCRGPILIGDLILHLHLLLQAPIEVCFYPCGADADYHHVPYMVTTHEDVLIF